MRVFVRTPGLKLVSGLVILLDLSFRILKVRTRGRVQGRTYSNLWKLKIDTTVSARGIQKRINELTPATASNWQSWRFHLRPCRFCGLFPFRGSGQKPLLVCSRVRMRLQIQIGKLFSEAKGNRQKKSITLQRGKPGNLAAFTALVVILLDMNSVQVSHEVLDRFSSVNAKSKQRRERDADVVCVSAKVTVSAVGGI